MVVKIKQSLGGSRTAIIAHNGYNRPFGKVLKDMHNRFVWYAPVYHTVSARHSIDGRTIRAGTLGKLRNMVLYEYQIVA